MAFRGTTARSQSSHHKTLKKALVGAGAQSAEKSSDLGGGTLSVWLCMRMDRNVLICGEIMQKRTVTREVVFSDGETVVSGTEIRDSQSTIRRVEYPWYQR